MRTLYLLEGSVASRKTYFGHLISNPKLNVYEFGELSDEEFFKKIEKRDIVVISSSKEDLDYFKQLFLKKHFRIQLISIQPPYISARGT